MKRLCIAALLLMQAALATTIKEKLNWANGQPVNGTVTISWPAFTTTSGQMVPKGSIAVQIRQGDFSVSLQPFAGYTANWDLPANPPAPRTQYTEYWTVPQSSTALTVGAVRTSAVPELGLIIALPQLDSGGATVNQIMTYNGQRWVPMTANASGLENGTSNMQVLVWNGDLSQWQAGALTAGDGIGITDNSTIVNTDKGTTARAAHEASNDHSKLPMLANVTSDVQGQIDNKQAALGYSPENPANRNTADGYAGLDSAARLRAAQMPAASGDVARSAGSTAETVVGIQGRAVDSTAPADGQMLRYNGTTHKWERVTLADQETPDGLIDGINATYTLTSTPNPANGLIVFRNGLVQKAGGFDYTLTDNIIEFVPAAIPQPGDTLLAWYRY